MTNNMESTIIVYYPIVDENIQLTWSAKKQMYFCNHIKAFVRWTPIISEEYLKLPLKMENGRPKHPLY